MSWFFKSLHSIDPDSSSSSSFSPEQQGTPMNPGGGVKEDLSVIGVTIGRQFRGVANFLAPVPSPPSAVAEDKTEQQFDSSSSSEVLLGIRNDLAEIGGSLKSGLSLISSNKVVSGISTFTSNLLQRRNKNKGEDVEDDGDYVPGITEEVIGFVKEISTKPECWIDFPLSLENDFIMSDAQREHASTVEHIVPSFTALRANLHGSVGEEQFWMIYFILLLPRLNEDDIEILSTTQIIETRNELLQKLQRKRNVKVESSENSNAVDSSQVPGKVGKMKGENTTYREMDVTEVINATEGLEIDDAKNTEQWLDETDIDTGISSGSQQKVEDEGDVSFSDLEDDDNDAATSGQAWADPSSGSSDWDQVNENPETRGGSHKTRQSISRDKDSDIESNGWLKVDDFD